MNKNEKDLMGQMLINTPDKLERLINILLRKGILNDHELKEIYGA